jgi:hypothetical protein
MSLPVVVALDHSGHFFATVQRRLKQEPFELYFYYQNLGHLQEIEWLHPSVITLTAQHGYPKNHLQVLAALRSFQSLKRVPIILSLAAPLEEPQAEQLGIKVVSIDPSLEDAENLVSALHEVLNAQ